MKEKYEAIVEENKKLKTKVNLKKEFMLKINFTFSNLIKTSLKWTVREEEGEYQFQLIPRLN